MWSFALRRHPARLPCRAISASAEPLVTRAAFLPALVTVAAENDSSERRQITREMEICERAAPLYEVIFVIETDGQRTDGQGGGCSLNRGRSQTIRVVLSSQRLVSMAPPSSRFCVLIAGPPKRSSVTPCSEATPARPAPRRCRHRENTMNVRDGRLYIVGPYDLRAPRVVDSLASLQPRSHRIRRRDATQDNVRQRAVQRGGRRAL